MIFEVQNGPIRLIAPQFPHKIFLSCFLAQRILNFAPTVTSELLPLYFSQALSSGQHLRVSHSRLQQKFGEFRGILYD